MSRIHSMADPDQPSPAGPALEPLGFHDTQRLGELEPSRSGPGDGRIQHADQVQRNTGIPGPNGEPYNIPNNGAAEVRLLDETMINALNQLHPEAEKAIRLMTEQIAEKEISTSHEICFQRMAELEAEVAEHRAARKAMEASNNHKWSLADERIRALEQGMAASEETERYETCSGTDTSNEAESYSDVDDDDDDESDVPPRGSNVLLYGRLTITYEEPKIVFRTKLPGTSLSRLLYAAPLGQNAEFGYAYTELGRRLDEPSVTINPTARDILVLRSPENYKLLLRLLFFLRARKEELVRLWREENQGLVKMLDPYRQPQDIERLKSPQFHLLREPGFPGRLFALASNPHGKLGQMVERRLLVRRAPVPSTRYDRLVVDKETYIDVYTEREIDRDIDDVVVEESEELYRKLLLMYHELEEEDLVGVGPGPASRAVTSKWTV